MGFFSKIFDDVLGLDPGGGGIYNVARDVLGDKIADDVLGMDPGGGGFIKEYNVLLPMIAGYYGLEALGGTEGIANMFGSGSGAAGTTFTEAQLAAASASADPIAYLASATPGAAVGAGEALAAGTLSSGGGAAGMGGAQGLSAGGGAGLASMGGAQGLGSGIGTGLASMGGAQGFGAGAASGIGSGIGAGIGAGTAGGFLNTLGKYATPIASVGNALLGAYSANKAAGAQSDAAKYAADLQNLQFQQSRADMMPFMQAGGNAVNRLSSGLAKGGEFDTPFSQAAFTQDPGYTFRLSEGQKQLDRMAAIRGGQISGSALKAAARFGQDMGSQEYNNAFNRYQTERNARLNPLQSLAGVGQTSTQQIGTMGANAASNVGNLTTDAAGARASGYMGVANAIGGGLNQYANYQQDQQLNTLLQQALRRG